MFRFKIPIFLYCKKVFRIRTQGKKNQILKVKPEIMIVSGGLRLGQNPVSERQSLGRDPVSERQSLGQDPVSGS